jgi:hypothetical protein
MAMLPGDIEARHSEGWFEKDPRDTARHRGTACSSDARAVRASVVSRCFRPRLEIQETHSLSVLVDDGRSEHGVTNSFPGATVALCSGRERRTGHFSIYRLGIDRGRPNHGSTVFSKRVNALI